MLRFCLGLVCLVLAVGAIDGPTGHEGDAWHLTSVSYTHLRAHET